MTTLFGCMLNEPERLACALYPVREALVWRHERQPDGWGLGFFQGGEVLLQKRPRPPAGPVDLFGLMQSLRTDCIVGHVRLATVGKEGRSENTAPYRFRSWLFAHNGTVDKFEEVRQHLRSHIPDFLQRNIRGQTDSEHLMHLFLAFMFDGGKLDDPNLPALDAAAALWAMLNLVDRLSVEAGGKAQPHAIIVTNGRMMVALRRGMPLAYLRVRGIEDCALCRQKQFDVRDVRRVPHEHLRGVIVIDDEGNLSAPWQPLPDGSAIAVNHDLTFEIRQFGTP